MIRCADEGNRFRWLLLIRIVTASEMPIAAKQFLFRNTPPTELLIAHIMRKADLGSACRERLLTALLNRYPPTLERLAGGTGRALTGRMQPSTPLPRVLKTLIPAQVSRAAMLTRSAPR